MPENPRIQPVNVFVVIPVYVIISLSIFNNPYLEGYPFVEVTVTTPTDAEILVVSPVNPTITSGVKLSSFWYWSRFSTISTVPPWYSWEI